MFCLNLCLNLQVKNCEKVPVKNFRQLNRSYFFENIMGRFLSFSFHMRFTFVLELRTFRGNFVLQRCHPNIFRCNRDDIYYAN